MMTTATKQSVSISGSPFSVDGILPRPSPHRPAILRALAAACFLASFGLASAADEPRPARPESYLSGIVSLLSKEWPSNRTVNIVCHGHSVPAGYFKTPRVQTFDAYPHLLHRELNQRFPTAVINVIVTAIGGENSEQGARRFERDVISLHPDVVLIDYALNDRGIGLARAEAAWRSMISRCVEKRLPVILLTPTIDMSAKLNDPNDALDQHAAQIRRLAAEFHVGLADSLAAFKDRIRAGASPGDFMSQSNHPNRAGHDLVASGLLKWFPHKISE